MTTTRPCLGAGAPAAAAEGGFTLIELMITVSILAVLLALAAPSFNDASVNSKISDNTNRLVSTTSLARGEAIKRNAKVVMCATTVDPTTLDSATRPTCAGSGGDWQNGWIVFHDKDADGALDTDETIMQMEPAAPSGYKIIDKTATPSTKLTFKGTGAAENTIKWLVCRATPGVHPTQRQLEVNAVGRSTITRLSGQTTCA